MLARSWILGCTLLMIIGCGGIAVVDVENPAKMSSLYLDREARPWSVENTAR
jgi:hypothetical protein